MKKITIKITALVLALVLLAAGFTGCGISDSRRGETPFSEMDYTITESDVESLKTIITNTTNEILNTTFFLKFYIMEIKLNQKLSDFYTRANVLEINRYLHSDDEELTRQLEWVSEEKVEIQNLVTEHNKAITESAFADDYKELVGDYAYEQMEIANRLRSDAVLELQKERSGISVKYNDYIANMTVDINGKTYTEDDLADLPYSDYVTALNKLYTDNAPQVTEMYNQLIQCDIKIAELLDFNDPIEMHYVEYSRDYTPEDSEDFFKTVKNDVVPLYDEIQDYMYVEDDVPQKRKETLATFEEVLGSLSDDRLLECYKYMSQYELIDSKASSSKQTGVGFTTLLSAYDSPFIYLCWENNFNSTSTLIHEFGHAFNYYEGFNRGTYEYSIDISEIFSQGLEVLMFPYYKEFTDKATAEELKKSQIAGMVVNSIIFQSMLEEFQFTAYRSGGNMTSDEYADLYVDLLIDYGLLPEGEYPGNSRWIIITHFFDAPFYTISYCTSACAALEIWSMSLDDWDKAFDTYIYLIDEDHEKDFVKFIDDAGLSSPFKKKTIEKICDDVLDYIRS